MSFCDEPGRQLHKASTTEIDTHVLDMLLFCADSSIYVANSARATACSDRAQS